MSKYNFVEFNKIQKKFIKDGYVIFDVKNKDKLNLFKTKIQSELKSSVVDFKNLNNIHKFTKKNLLNELRLKVLKKINQDLSMQKNYFEIGRDVLEDIVGNEMAMQNEISLSIQLPRDDSSLLNLHADTWSGNSPYEVVLWIPLDDVYETKSMFLLDVNEIKNFNRYFKKNNDLKSVYKKFKKKFKFLNLNYGQALIFNQNIPHGNMVNLTKETRWSMNCRFKSLFSPYRYKKFAEVFRPISTKPATITAIKYIYPKKVNENF